jgi:hypothetical protein
MACLKVMRDNVTKVTVTTPQSNPNVEKVTSLMTIIISINSTHLSPNLRISAPFKIMYFQLSDSEIRSICKERIESLEYWLRRLIDNVLTNEFGDYFTFQDEKGNFAIKADIRKAVEQRTGGDPNRYPRKIDAIMLDDAVSIVCNENLFKYFREALGYAFPDGAAEARTFLKRLVEPRNRLAHANSISIRDAERIVCYTNDVIESLKRHYSAYNMNNTYNVPLILKFVDSFGNTVHRNEMHQVHDGGIGRDYYLEPSFDLRPGDVLGLEVEVDPSFVENEYVVSWGSTKLDPKDFPSPGKKAVIPITNRQVSQRFDVQCRVTSKKEWHRMSLGSDDFMLLVFRVLPPV